MSHHTPQSPGRQRLSSKSKRRRISVLRVVELKVIGLLVVSVSLVGLVRLSTRLTQSQHQEDLSDAAPIVLKDGAVVSAERKAAHRPNSATEDATANSVMTFNQLDNISSVDYVACCGLGHRLARMSAAYSVARQVKFVLRSHWGWCGGDEGIVEVYSTLFEPMLYNYSEQEDKETSITSFASASKNYSTGHRIRFLNDVPAFHSLVRTGESARCPCDDTKITTDYEFYDNLRRRFHHRPLEHFVSNFFVNHTVVGLHIRGGNGEGGDFARKKRSIANPKQWIERVWRHIQTLYDRYGSSNSTTMLSPLLLYVATDTPIFVDLLRQVVAPFHIPIVEWAQTRASHGVYFGETGHIANRDAPNQSDCLQRWNDTVTDLMLLSYADVVISGRPSSFVQTLPMSLALGRRVRKLPVTYCEVVGDKAESMPCFHSFKEWCCNHPTWIDTGKEFVQFAPVADWQRPAPVRILERPADTSTCYPRPGTKAKRWCLPHKWRPF